MRFFTITIISIFIACFYKNNACAQIFYFENTETTLDKETNNSPLHWYIEIHTTLQEDTTLRWKSTFDNIPTEWNVNIDCQTENYFDISDGDSADFVLSKEQDLINNNDTFPQKMIISVFLNDTPGKGTVLFDVFDPENPSETEQIKFHFLISLSPNASISESELKDLISIKNGVLKNKSSQKVKCGVFDVQGRTLYNSNHFKESIDLSKHKGEIVFINLIDNKNNFYQIKTVL